MSGKRRWWFALFGLATSSVVLYLLLFRKRGGRMLFEFGQTDQNKAFFDRHPKFYPAFERLMDLANKCFGRASGAKNHAQDICFGLGHTCRDDYTEILFLVVNGYGTGA